ncbi:MAG: RNA 2',3'-cyclic phosphodiesterase [Candidatus ainarchaeum sp.]|nr:RNA 2',3'-cyclic phosphodiesterase [Candidatus ainarchaeum sp.]
MENSRLFFAVNFSEELKEKIFNELAVEIPEKGFGKTSRENLHITLVFLGFFPKEKIPGLREKAMQLKNFKGFEAELCEIRHFKGRILWLGIGKGSEEVKLLAKKLCEAIGIDEENFHAHVTLARNKSATKKEFDAVLEKLGAKNFSEKIAVKSLELMESKLSPKGSIYKKVFSVELG